MITKPLRDEPLVDRIIAYAFAVIILTCLTYFGAHFLYYLIGG